MEPTYEDGVRIDFSVDKASEGKSIRRYLQDEQNISRRLLVRLKKCSAVLLNGEPALLHEEVREGDRITLCLPPEEDHLPPQPVPFEILYEDRDILAVDKPPGICVHPTMGYADGTLANGVMHHWRRRGIKAKFRPVNRLDKNTSGIVLIAKHALAHQQLSLQQQKGVLRREYVAIVHGRIEDDRGTIAAPIALKEGSIIERTVRSDGQKAVTHFYVLKRTAHFTYLKLMLETGRTHQIRVHMRHIGHPLLGDDLYGGTRDHISRQALHAAHTAFRHPIAKRPLALTADLPEDMKAIMR